MPNRPEPTYRRSQHHGKLESLRQDYMRAGLRRADLDPDAIRQFEHWFAEALAADLREPNAMTLATASADGAPSARTVLLKGLDQGEMLFYTNYESDKARQLAENPRAALVFLWLDLERQVRVTGTVKKATRRQTADYFATRPRGSRLAAWSSTQSRVIADRKVLEDELARLESKFEGRDIPPPPFWGGYRLKPQTIEFWQGRPNRLHDRFRYTRRGRSWKVERLAP